ncbi:KH domain-containing protein [Candidatus Woesearchaeota archaeon]|nr:KH domain-containing protein [Candidatus Woesearchaeota archaeon]
MTEFMYLLRIPKDRIAVLIGKKGEIKKRLEQETSCQLKIDSKEGEIEVVGKDALGLYTSREIIQAIGRGFNPDFALLLLKQDFVFEQVNIADYMKSKDASMQRLRGRVIGKEGKARRYIEEMTETHISVYGKTIGIIGETESASIARQAIENLLKGSQHSNVYHWLEKKKKEMKRKEFEEEKIELK